MRTFTAKLGLALLLGGSVFAAGVPNTINYQGRLTDAAGDAVPDGSIFVKFTIYNASVGGTALWNSGFNPITTVDGLFSYDLGSNVTLPDIFGTDTVRYLGISVDADPEISPRTRFTCSGYVFKSLHSDSALYSDRAGYGITSGLSEDADALGGETPDFYLDWGNMTNIPAGFADGTDDVSGPAGGDLMGTYPNPSIAFGAITSGKVFDETGFAANRMTGNLFLPKSTTMTDVITVTITIPENGYIIVEGLATVGFYPAFAGSISRVSGFLQIDESAGGSAQSLHYAWGGFPVFSTSGVSGYQTINTRRVYFKTPGTYLFRMEGAQDTQNITGAKFIIFNSWIQATFNTTAYGSVTTVAGNPGDHPDANAVSVTDIDGSVSTAYKMDLRYYEEKARAARIAAQKAELEKLQAQNELARARQSDNDK